MAKAIILIFERVGKDLVCTTRKKKKKKKKKTFAKTRFASIMVCLHLISPVATSCYIFSRTRWIFQNNFQ